MSDNTTVIVKYDEQAMHWSATPEINELFVTTVLNFSTDRLKARKYLFLNEVLAELGLPRTSQGQLVGWLYSENETLWEMVTSSESDDIILKFYTHGVMYDKIEEAS